MAKKKTLLVETHKAGAEWSIKVSGRGARYLSTLWFDG